MSTASAIVAISVDHIDMFENAENSEDLKEVDQNWDEETTTFTFQDGSKLKFNDRYFEIL